MAARHMVAAGHRVVLHARNEQRAADARSSVPRAEAVVIGDLSGIEATREVASQVNRLGDFDAVIHNAGIGYREKHRTATVDGLPNVFAVNSLAPYILTALMNKPKRLVYLSSGMHHGAEPELDDLAWKPRTYLHLGAASAGATFKPAGLDRSKGILSGGFLKDVTDPKWANDDDVKEWMAWMKDNMPGAELSDSLNEAGYMYAKTLEQVLKQCGDDLTRENIMKQAASLKDFHLPLLLPGSAINTSPTDYRVIQHMKLQRFNGKSWDFTED